MSHKMIIAILVVLLNPLTTYAQEANAQFSLLTKAAESDIFSRVTGKWSRSNAKSPCVEDFHTIRFLKKDSVAEFTGSKPRGSTPISRTV